MRQPSKNAHRIVLLATVVTLGLWLWLPTASAATLYASGIATFPVLTQSALYTLDPVSGAPSQVGGMDTQLPSGALNTIYNGGLAYDPTTDRLFAVGCDSANVSRLYLVDRTNGDLTVVGSPTGGAELCAGGVTFDETNAKLYAVGQTAAPQGGLWEIDPDTGAGTLIGLTGTDQWFMYGVGSDPATGVLYANGRTGASGPNGEFSALFVLDKATGAAAFVGYHGATFGRQLAYSGLAFEPVTGEMLSLGSTSASAQALFVVDRSTGLATVRGANQTPNIGVDGGLVFVEPNVQGVPALDPRGLLILPGLLALMGWRRLRT